MPSIALPAHGEYALSLEGAVVCLRARGPWNREAVVQYRDEFSELTAPLGDRPWGLLGIVQGEALLLPDAAELLKQHTAADAPRGRVATALVLDQVLLVDLVQDQFRALYQGQAQAVEFFSDIERARSWLEAQLERAHCDTFAASA